MKKSTTLVLELTKIFNYYGLLVKQEKQLTDNQPMGEFVIVEKSTTLVLGVTIIDNILSSKQEVTKISSRCDRRLTNTIKTSLNITFAKILISFDIRLAQGIWYHSYSRSKSGSDG